MKAQSSRVLPYSYAQFPQGTRNRHYKWHKHQCRNTALKHQGPRGDHDSRRGVHGNSGGFNTTNQEKTMKIGQIKIDVYFDPEQGKFHFPTFTGRGPTGHLNQPVKLKLRPPRKRSNWTPTRTPSKRIKPPSNKRDIFSTGLPRPGAKRRAPARLTPTAPTNQHQTVQADWYGDATEIELSQDDPDFDSKKDRTEIRGISVGRKGEGLA